MSGYILTVITVCIIGTLVTTLAPDGEGGGISRNIRLVFALCVILVCIDPIKSGIELLTELDIESVLDGEVSEGEKYEEIFDSSYDAAEKKNLEEGIKTMLEGRFGISGSECEVSTQITDGVTGERRVDRIYITLYGSAIWKDTGLIEEYLARIFSCEVISAIG